MGREEAPLPLIVRRADAAQNRTSRFFAELARRGRAHGIRLAAEMPRGCRCLDDGTTAGGARLDAATQATLPEHDPADTDALLARRPDLLVSMAFVETTTHACRSARCACTITSARTADVNQSDMLRMAA